MRRNKNNAVGSFLRTLFRTHAGRSRSEHQTDFQALGHASGGLEADYQRLVEHHLRRWGVPESCASVEIQQIEQRKGRRDIFVATISLDAWDRDGVLRVLLGLPLLDKKIRKAVPALWLGEVSEFRGVQLRVSPALGEAAPTSELRQLVVSLTGPRRPVRSPEPDSMPMEP
jgi:hypothetical protein